MPRKYDALKRVEDDDPANVDINPRKIGAKERAEYVGTKRSNATELTVGNASPVTGGPVGDSGEWVPLESGTFSALNASTTSTSFVQVHGNTDRFTMDVTMYSGLTNISEVAVSLHLRQLGNDTAGETTTGRIHTDVDGGLATTEITHTGTGGSFNLSSARATLSNNAHEMRVYWKVTGGTGDMQAAPHLVTWGKIA